MAVQMTPEQITRRTSAAVEAAIGAGRELGLTVTDARVLHDLFSVVVHLAPAPVVARVPTVLPPSTGLVSLSRRQQAELDVTRWLADQGTPVIPPSPLVPGEPVLRDGFSMTFWQYVEEAEPREPSLADYEEYTESVADLHVAMRAYPGELSFLSAAEPRFITEGLSFLEQRPDLLGPTDLERARREWQLLKPLVSSREAFEQRFPGVESQPLHGDSPPANIFAGKDGNLFSDFELVTWGPIEWDLAALGPDLQAAYDRGAQRAGGRPLRQDVLDFVDGVGMLRVVSCLALTPQLPSLLDHLLPALDHWRATPLADHLTP